MRSTTSGARRRRAPRPARTRCTRPRKRTSSIARSPASTPARRRARPCGERGRALRRMAVEVRIPPLGESVTEGVIVRWAKRDGETVAKDDVLLELETDKATMEIAAESAGTLHVLRQEGDTVNVGDVVGSIDDGLSTPAPRVRLATDVDGGESPSAAPARPAAPLPSPGPGPVATPNLEGASEQDAVATARGVGPLSPAVRKLIEEHELDPAAIAASGKGGRLLKEDVLAYLERRDTTSARATNAAPRPTA
ncbi:MAG: hypothetical protein E6J72_18930, partial [Deltaproteobacteria bacterium]